MRKSRRGVAPARCGPETSESARIASTAATTVKADSHASPYSATPTTGTSSNSAETAVDATRGEHQERHRRDVEGRADEPDARRHAMCPQHQRDGGEQQDTARPEHAHVRRPRGPQRAELTSDHDEGEGGAAHEQLTPSHRNAERPYELRGQIRGRGLLGSPGDGGRHVPPTRLGSRRRRLRRPRWRFGRSWHRGHARHDCNIGSKRPCPEPVDNRVEGPPRTNSVRCPNPSTLLKPGCSSSDVVRDHERIATRRVR